MVTSSIENENYRVTINNGRHTFFGDEPIDKGGKDTAPAPDELLEAALASCTLVTLRMYTNHKQWNVGKISISVSLLRENETGKFTRELKFENEITQEQKQRLVQVAKACPVSKIVSGSVEMLVEVK